MKRIKAFFRRHELSLKGKIIRNLVLIVLLLGVIFIASGSPGITEHMRLRTAERARMVGPGEILARVPVTGLSYPAVYVIDEGSGLAIKTTDDPQTFNSWENRFVYLPRTGDVTMVAAPAHYLGKDPKKLVVFAMDAFPDAVRAELTVTMEEDDFSETYTAASEREYAGFFVFEIEGKYPSVMGTYTSEEHCFSRVAGGSSTDGFPATVRFYDETEALITEVETRLTGNMYLW